TPRARQSRRLPGLTPRARRARRGRARQQQSWGSATQEAGNDHRRSSNYFRKARHFRAPASANPGEAGTGPANGQGEQVMAIATAQPQAPPTKAKSIPFSLTLKLRNKIMPKDDELGGIIVSLFPKTGGSTLLASAKSRSNGLVTLTAENITDGEYQLFIT